MHFWFLLQTLRRSICQSERPILLAFLLMKAKISDLKYPAFPLWGIPLEHYTTEKVLELIKEIIPTCENRGWMHPIIHLQHILAPIAVQTVLEKGGQIEPVIVDKDNNLVDGLHRLMGHILAGKENIEIKRGVAIADKFKEFFDVYNSKDRFQKIRLPHNLRTTQGRDDIYILFNQIGLGETFWKGKSILDIGCDCGGWLFEALHRGAKEGIGIDKNPESLGLASWLACLYGYPIKFLLSDFSDVAWNSIPESDVVFANQCIYRFKEGAESLDIIARKCKDYLIMFMFLGMLAERT